MSRSLELAETRALTIALSVAVVFMATATLLVPLAPPAEVATKDLLSEEVQTLWQTAMGYEATPVFHFYREWHTKNWVVMVSVVPRGRHQKITIWRAGADLPAVLGEAVTELKARY